MWNGSLPCGGRKLKFIPHQNCWRRKSSGLILSASEEPQGNIYRCSVQLEFRTRICAIILDYTGPRHGKRGLHWYNSTPYEASVEVLNKSCKPDQGLWHATVTENQSSAFRKTVCGPFSWTRTQIETAIQSFSATDQFPKPSAFLWIFSVKNKYKILEQFNCFVVFISWTTLDMLAYFTTKRADFVSRRTPVSTCNVQAP